MTIYFCIDISFYFLKWIENPIFKQMITFRGKGANRVKGTMIETRRI